MDSVAATLTQRLADVVNQCQLGLSEQQQQTLLLYVALLDKWNKAYNLTAAKSQNQIFADHILDCLPLIPFVTGKRIVDVGSGAGLPGIVLAIAHPDKQFTLTDSNGKKTRFLTQMKIDLNLQNVEVVNCRVEQLDTLTNQVDSITARAFSDVADIVNKTRRLAHGATQWLLLKTSRAKDEIDNLAAEYEIEFVPLVLPTDAPSNQQKDRILVKLSSKSMA